MNKNMQVDTHMRYVYS